MLDSTKLPVIHGPEIFPYVCRHGNCRLLCIPGAVVNHATSAQVLGQASYKLPASNTNTVTVRMRVSVLMLKRGSKHTHHPDPRSTDSPLQDQRPRRRRRCSCTGCEENCRYHLEEYINNLRYQAKGPGPWPRSKSTTVAPF